VLHWFGNQIAEDVHVTAVTMAEILHGIELISTGRRQTYFVQVPKRCSGMYSRIVF